jgi:hypothetical protein
VRKNGKTCRIKTKQHNKIFWTGYLRLEKMITSITFPSTKNTLNKYEYEYEKGRRKIKIRRSILYSLSVR